MEPQEFIKKYTGPATYQITVKGKVDPAFMNQLNDLSVSHTEMHGHALTTLTGKIADEEALNGLLNILFDHQYPVISLMKFDI